MYSNEPFYIIGGVLGIFLLLIVFVIVPSIKADHAETARLAADCEAKGGFYLTHIYSQGKTTNYVHMGCFKKDVIIP